MIHYVVTFDWKFPSLNELMLAKAVTGKKAWIPIGNKRSRHAAAWNEYNALKQRHCQKVAAVARLQGARPLEKAYFTYMFTEATKKRDPSNFIGAAIKLIEDGLVTGGLMPNDGWNHVLGIAVSWQKSEDKTDSVKVALSSAPLTQEEIAHAMGP